MPTWEKVIVKNPRWMDTSNPKQYVIKEYDSATEEWVPTAPTTAAEIGAYSTDEMDDKIAILEARLAALEGA